MRGSGGEERLKTGGEDEWHFGVVGVWESGRKGFVVRSDSGNGGDPVVVRRALLKMTGPPMGMSRRIGNLGCRVRVENQKRGGRLRRAKEYRY